MKRKKPPQDHTSQAAPADAFAVRPIGYVRSPYKERFGTPRQPTVTEQTLTDAAVDATIELLPSHNFEQALKDLEGFERIWVVAWMHLNENWKPTVIPPRGPKVRRGLFATRSPHRPNPIAISALRLTRIDGLTLHVNGIDLLDGTPVLDIKPYVPYTDAFPDAREGWLETIGEAPDAPDRWSATPMSASRAGGTAMCGVTILDRDLGKDVLSFDLRDILPLLGADAERSTWTIRGVECLGGDAAAILHQASEALEEIAGHRLAYLAHHVGQIIDGEFSARLPSQSEVWIKIRAVDSSAFDVETDREDILAALKARFVRVEDLPAE